jgi:hypothetical protein
MATGMSASSVALGSIVPGLARVGIGPLYISIEDDLPEES